MLFYIFENILLKVIFHYTAVCNEIVTMVLNNTRKGTMKVNINIHHNIHLLI